MPSFADRIISRPRREDPVFLATEAKAIRERSSSSHRTAAADGESGSNPTRQWGRNTHTAEHYTVKPTFNRHTHHPSMQTFYLQLLELLRSLVFLILLLGEWYSFSHLNAITKLPKPPWAMSILLRANTLLLEMGTSLVWNLNLNFHDGGSKMFFGKRPLIKRPTSDKDQYFWCQSVIT